MEFSDNKLSGADTIRSDQGEINPPGQEPLIGFALADRYLIERKLGQGGFGAVYLAADQKMVSRKVVVKILHARETQNEWSVKKFQQEIEALSRLNHPGIVGIFDTGETIEGSPYIVMQFVDGSSLRSLITPEGMPFWRAASIISQMGRALSAAHQGGILHRDLKPENVMLQKLEGDEEHVKIIDFGVAKIRNSQIALSTGKDRAVGTIAYMSPEQLLAQPLTPASDIYSLGVVVYELLTGRRPMNPDSAFQLLELQRSGVLIKPSDLRPSLPRAAEEIILKALSFEPKDRLERARDFCDAVASALTGDEDEMELQKTAVIKASHIEADTLTLETAHVLFMDLVGYSTLLIDEQRMRLRTLQEMVLATVECRNTNARDLIRLPTGDGMALVFFGDPEAPVRCATEISRALREETDLKLRLGVHSGLVYRVADINTNLNVTGGGINTAQRVMDCGDHGHILVSKRVADDLGQLARWSSYLHDLGIREVKHGVQLHLFNLWSEDFGNAAIPSRFHDAGSKQSKRIPYAVAAALLLVAIIAAAVWLNTRQSASTTLKPAPPVTTVAILGPERSFNYWLTIQKMLNEKRLGNPVDSAGDVIYGTGWEFYFNIQPKQDGALYLLSEGDGQKQFNVLFPLPDSGQLDPRLAADQRRKTGPYVFVQQTGVEKFWMIWSAQPVSELDEIFAKAVDNKKDPGVIADPDQVSKVLTYLKKFETEKPEVVPDKARRLTTVKGHGDLVVNRLELSHEEN